MLNSLIIIAALALLGGLLYFEKKENLVGVLLTKAPLSGLFILTAVLQPQTHRTYYFLFFRYLCCPQSIYIKRIPEPALRASTVLWRSILAGLFHRQYLNIYLFRGLVSPPIRKALSSRKVRGGFFLTPVR
jgi:hypothetical protein